MLATVQVTLYLCLKKAAEARLCLIRSKLALKKLVFPKLPLRKQGLIFLVVTVFTVFSVYLYTLAPSVPLQGDAGELITVAKTLGIAHPPGYPLYTLIAHLFTYLPINSFAWRVNLLSALAHTFTLIIFFKIVFRLSGNYFVSVVTTLTLAFSQTFWLYSIVTEVFAVNDLLVVLVVFLTLGKVPNFYSLMIIFSLGMAHHHTLALLLPAVIFYLRREFWAFLRRETWKKGFLLGLMAIIFGFIPYLYFLIRAKTAVVPVAWYYPDDFFSLWRLLSRSDYGTFLPYAGARPDLATLADKGVQLKNYFYFLIDDFSWWGLLVIFLGVIYGWVKMRRKTAFLLLNIGVSLFFLVYASFPLNEATGTALAVVERFYLLPNIFLSFCFGLGLSWGWQMTKKQNLARLGLVSLAVLYLAFHFGKNFHIVNQRDNYLGLEFGKNILMSADKEAIILPGGDIPTFVVFYARYVEGIRPDIELLTSNQSHKNNQYRYLKKVRPNLNLDFSLFPSTTEVVRENAEKIPFYSFGLAGEIPGFVASPSGLLVKITPVSSLEDPRTSLETSRKIIASYQLPSEDALRSRLTLADRSVFGFYGDMFAYHGNYSVAVGDDYSAEQFYKQSLFYDPANSLVKLALADLYKRTGRCEEAEGVYLNILGHLPDNHHKIYTHLKDLAIDCFGDPEREGRYSHILEEIDKRDKSSSLSKMSLEDL